MELFEEIRRGHAAGETILGLARQYGIHRRMVRQAIASAVPPERKQAERAQPALRPVREAIDAILEADRTAPRKQRHTAHRIWVRLREAYPEHPLSESTVGRYVAKRRREMGLVNREVYVPQSCEWGQEAQVDWFEASVKLSGQMRNLQIFAMRSMASGDAFHRAYERATQQALLEAHEHAFAYFGGVFKTLRYDIMGLLGPPDPPGQPDLTIWIFCRRGRSTPTCSRLIAVSAASQCQLHSALAASASSRLLHPGPTGTHRGPTGTA